MRLFILDVHLGRLARDLRMLGFDSLWKDDYADSELLEVSKTESRILLTRDRALYESAPAETAHYVQALTKSGQLLEVLKRFELVKLAREARGFLSRCLQCNSPILPAKPHQILHLVSGDIATQFDEFFFCPRCERVYWKGSHWDRMRAWVQQLMEQA